MTCPVLLCHAMPYSAMPCPDLPYSVCQYTWTVVSVTFLGVVATSVVYSCEHVFEEMRACGCGCGCGYERESD